jgi:tRNA threonylcarbamoyl adenosine modification protein YjeE
MTEPFILSDISETGLARFAEHIAFMLSPGDVLALEGDLGAGKTTFSRALIRALSNGNATEVPSPTFTLVQTYSADRFEIAHFDLYRLADPDELLELGLDLALKRGAAVIEWPSRAEELLPEERFTLALTETNDPETRNLTLTGSGSCAKRIARLAEVYRFLERKGWGTTDAHLTYLQGDASPRRYARLRKDNGDRAILMDAPRQPDGPPIRNGKPYSRLAHLAEDVRPFVAIASALDAEGFSTPRILAHDMKHGLLIIEDLGDSVFAAEIARGKDQNELWRRATDTLTALRQHRPQAPLPLPDGTTHALPLLDEGTLQIETELLVDWYWPAVIGTHISETERKSFLTLWQDVFARLMQQPKGWVLRDYHSPNLIALDDRSPPRDVGIIDFQDALLGPEAYDLVSVLQDARLDVPKEIESEMLARYAAAAQAANSGHFDEQAFRFAYAALGAQRNSKILGIFARLAKRDGKRQYLAHVPRIWGYLACDLAHPDLAALRAWYDDHFPPAMRQCPLNI